MKTTTHRQMLTGAALALCGTLLFSTKSIFIKQAYAFGIDPVSLMFLRMLMSLPFYLVIYLLYRRRATALTPQQWLLVCVTGCIGYYLASYLDLTGLLYISASFERLILYTFPTIVLLLSIIFLKHTIKRVEISAMVLCYGGLLVIYMQDVSKQGDLVTQGVLLVFASAIAFAIYVVASGQLISQVGAIRFTSLSMMSAGIAISIHYFSAPVSIETDWYGFSAPIYYLTFILALFCTVLPSYLISMGIQRIGATRSAIISTISPVFTIVLAMIFLDERSTLFHIAGFALVIGGIGMLNFVKNDPDNSLIAKSRRKPAD